MDIAIKNLSKSYKRIKALDNINLVISSGIHGFLGPNGAGKTTLLRILATILDADEGSITLGELYDWNKPNAIKGNIGFLPQSFGMYRYLKVEEALLNVALLKGIPENMEREQVELAIERTNLSEHAKRKVGQLSGGMLRRLGIAQAILGEPKILIMDEPSVGLDPSERISFRKLLREYNNGERIIIISSHIVNDLESLCDKVSIMNQGKLIASGEAIKIQKAAEGYVKEEIVDDIQLKEIEENYAVINFTPVNSEFRVRYLTDEQTDINTKMPTLEDSYTFIIQKGLEI